MATTFRQALLRDIAAVFDDFMYANKTVSSKIKTQIHK